MTTPDHSDLIASASQLTPGITAHGSFEEGLDVDWYAVTLQAGVPMLFSLGPSAGVTPYTGGYHPYALAVHDSAGRPLTTLLPGSDVDKPVLQFTPATSGTYYVAATSTYEWHAMGQYDLQAARRSGTDDYRHDRATTAVLPAGGTFKGTFEVAGDRDWIRIHAEPGTHYRFSATIPEPGQINGSVFPSSLRIVDADGNELPPSISGGLDVAAAGDYYVDVLGLRPGQYTLVSETWHDDYPSFDALASAIAPGATLSGKIDYEYDIDRFKVHLEAGRFYTIDMNAYGDYCDLDLRDGAGHTIDSIIGREGRLVVRADATGDYYVDAGRMLTTRFPGPMDYALTVSAGSADDAGDTVATAAAAVVGATVQGHVQGDGDHDLYRVALAAGKSYAVLMQVAGTAPMPLALALRDGGGQALASAGTDIYARSTSVRFTAQHDGDYFIDTGARYAGSEFGYSMTLVELSGDGLGPTLTASTHASGASNVGLTNTKMTLTFSEPVTIDATLLTLTDGIGQRVYFGHDFGTGVAYPYAIGRQLFIDTLDYFKPGTYTLTIPHAAVHDLAGNAYTGPETFTFTTTPTAAHATGSNDLLAGGSAGTIDGGAGIDTVLYPDTIFPDEIRRDGNTVTVRIAHGGSSDTLVDIERLVSERQAIALDIDGHGGQAYRLYQAAFDRAPDLPGVGFWMAHLDNGMALLEVAQRFLDSAEFGRRYGNAQADDAFVNLMYRNVLHRDAEPAGFQHWMDQLHGGMSRADVLVHFSESAENVAALVGTIGNGFQYTPYHPA